MSPQFKESREIAQVSESTYYVADARCTPSTVFRTRRSRYPQVSGEEGETQRDKGSSLKSKWTTGRAELKVRQSGSQDRTCSGRHLYAATGDPSDSTPHRAQAPVPLKGSLLAGRPGDKGALRLRAVTALDAGSSTGGARGLQTQSGPWLTRHHANTELKTS